MPSAPQSPMMPNFIQAMYGTVIGVGSLEYVFDAKVLTDSIFQFMFFDFSILIIAHDWYVFHKLERKSDEKFWPYTFQVGSLFFLAQMMYAAKGMKLPPVGELSFIDRFKSVAMLQWYVYGLAYTFFNYISKGTLKENQVPKHVHTIIYGCHFGICIVTIVLLCTFHFPAFFAYTWLLFTIIIVIVLWEYREREMKKMRTFGLRSAEKPMEVQLGLPTPSQFTEIEQFTVPRYPVSFEPLNHLKIIEIFENVVKSDPGDEVEKTIQKVADSQFHVYIRSLNKDSIDLHRKRAIHELFKPE